MSVLALASLGGLASLLSTSLGSVLTQVLSKTHHLKNLHMSMDFTLGVMLSAAAFLIAPELISNSTLSLFGVFFGVAGIFLIHNFIQNNSTLENKSTHLLIAALIFHNFPEGMGAGASLAGMELNVALSIQGALAIQNIMEGALLTILLISLGLTPKMAVLGGIASGGVELIGGVVSGLILEQTINALPFILSLAGGAMFASVGLEIYEHKKVKITDFISGLAVIPIMNQLI